MIIEQSKQIISEINRAFIGKNEVIEKVLMTIYAGGHVLLEDCPGVGKTTLAVAFSRVLGLSTRRIQFTPDTLPSDITGFTMWNRRTSEFEYREGAANCQLLLADEINRTSPKTQSALLEIMEERTITVDGESVAIGTNLKRGLTECVKLTYSARQPDVSVPLIKTFNNLKYDFYRNFIQNDNWRYITKGLWVTLRVTFFSVIIGIALGFLVAIVRVTNEKTGKLKLANAICKLYLTVLRGTPVLVQLMIVYFVIFMPIGIDKFIAAVICFGLNSGAYVAEIVRGGIQSIDAGQMEAGRSLGFGYAQTMLYIIMPQTFKAVLPALLNEFIGLLKETSVSAYIGLNDLARGGDIIRGVTYSAFMPLIAVAAVYLAVVVFLQWVVGKLERRLRTNER